MYRHNGFTPFEVPAKGGAVANRNLVQMGFTIIELLVVIAIIGILAVIVMVNLYAAKASSRDARRVEDVKALINSMHVFFSDNDRFPVASGTQPDSADGNPTWGSLSSWPTAPGPEDGSCTAAENTYTYTETVAADGSPDFNIAFCIGSPVGEIPAGVHNATSGSIQ